MHHKLSSIIIHIMHWCVVQDITVIPNLLLNPSIMFPQSNVEHPGYNGICRYFYRALQCKNNVILSFSLTLSHIFLVQTKRDLHNLEQA